MSLNKIFTINYLNEIKVIFNNFDENKDGYIEIHNIERALRILGLNPYPEEMKDIFKDLKGKSISFFALLYIINRLSKNTNFYLELIDSFEVFDIAHTGRIHINLVKKILKNTKYPFSNEQIEELLSDLELIKDTVNYKELVEKILK